MDTNETPSNDLAKKRDDLFTNATDDDAMLEHLMHEDEGDEPEDLLEQLRDQIREQLLEELREELRDQIREQLHNQQRNQYR